jgi:signal transduction histidine kinase
MFGSFIYFLCFILYTQMPENTKIHIIDDDVQTIQVLFHLLQKRGYQVRSSLSGQEALREFETYSPDLILLDIIMPEMDGYEVCGMIKSSSKLSLIPVIFITASNDTSELVKGFDAGAVDFISKPLNKAELLARVNTHVELKRARDLIEKSNYALSMEVKSRKQAEEKFRALSETTFEAVLFLQDNKIIEMNKAAVKLFCPVTEYPSIFSFTDRKGTQLLKNILQTKDSAGPWEIGFIDSKEKPFYGQVQYQSFNYKGESVNVLAIRDITRQKEIDNEIFNAIIEAEEKERKRFSRDMHDGLGALLSTLKIYVNLFQKPNKDASEKEMLLVEIKETINKAVESARTIANNLMPSVLMDHGLIKALKSFSDALNKTGVISVDFRWPKEQISIDPVIETHLYRISLELINNTLKYADASNIHLEIESNGRNLFLKYSDDGRGCDFESVFNKKAGSQGLKNILSRVNFMNGEGQFQTSPGMGLSFSLEIPI